MTFEELKNGMKDLFSSLGAKTSDSNYAVGLFDKTSAEPKGIMDMASLASVLGGITNEVKYVSVGADDLAGGVYQWYQASIATLTNYPCDNGFMICRTYVKRTGGNPYKLQIAYASDGRCFSRTKWEALAWSAWKEL